jgi:hypothetical protein
MHSKNVNRSLVAFYMLFAKKDGVSWAKSSVHKSSTRAYLGESFWSDTLMASALRLEICNRG